MAMMASKGPEDVFASNVREVRSVVLEPRRSPAPRLEEVVDWIWEAEKSLCGRGGGVLAGFVGRIG